MESLADPWLIPPAGSTGTGRAPMWAPGRLCHPGTPSLGCSDPPPRVLADIWGHPTPSASLFPLQVLLIISGNLSFLNWLTMVPSLACFDDASLGPLLGRRLRERAARLQLQGRSLALGESPREGKRAWGAWPPGSDLHSKALLWGWRGLAVWGWCLVGECGIVGVSRGRKE